MNISNKLKVLSVQLDLDIKLFQNSNLVSEFIRHHAPESIFYYNLEDYKYLSNRQAKHVEIYKNLLGLRYISAISEQHTLVIGPFLSTHDSISVIKKLTNITHLSSNQYSSVLNYLNTLKFQSEESLVDILNICFSFLFKKEVSYNEVKLSINKVLDYEEINQSIEDELYFKNIEKNYQNEVKHLRMIEAGDVEGVKSMINSRKFQVNIASRQAENPLRNQKNLILTMNSISCRAAYKGGVSAQLAHKMSTKYAIEIEACSNEVELNKLSSKMLVDYPTLVRDHTLNKLSDHIRESIRFIERNLTNAFSIPDIAGELHISTEHLQRQFKKEMNMTIKKYILKQRIEESIELLKNDVYSITYLSNLFQFSNPSHFSSVFKSHVGLSPRDFKKKYININN